MNPRVRSVVARDDHKLEIEFQNGETGIYDSHRSLSSASSKNYATLAISSRPREKRYGRLATRAGHLSGHAVRGHKETGRRSTSVTCGTILGDGTRGNELSPALVFPGVAGSSRASAAHLITPKVLNSKAQGKPKRRQPRGATLGTRVKKHHSYPNGVPHVWWSRARVPCETPLGFEFVSFRYPGCASRSGDPGLWSVTPSAFVNANRDGR